MSHFRETTYLESTPRIDKDAGILYGVKLLGEHSKNGRRYTPEAMRKAVPLYEGTKSFADHPERSKLGEDRKFEDWTGVYRNVHYREGQGIFADEHLRKTSDYFAGIVEAAEKFPKEVGKSHVAGGDSRWDGKSEIVESITEVFSVDWVMDPATTAGIWESKGKGAVKTTTLKQAVESLPESKQRKLLLENLASGYLDGDMAFEPQPDADPLTQIMSLLKSAIDALTEVAVASKEKQEPAMGPKPATQPTSPSAQQNTPPTQPDPAKLAAENIELKHKLDLLEAKAMLLESGRASADDKIREAQVTALAGTASESRQALLETWAKVEATTSGIGTFGSRPDKSPPIKESHDGNSANDASDRYAAQWKEAVAAARTKKSAIA